MLLGSETNRVLTHSHYVIPWRYLTKHYLIYNKALQRPRKLPAYYSATEWAIQFWWTAPDQALAGVPTTQQASLHHQE